MSQIKRIGLDTSQAVFTLHCVDQTGQAVLRTNLRRAQMATYFKKLPPAEIAIEACGSSHHWARELTALGHEVRLIPPQYVKPFVKRAKNDRNRAARTASTPVIRVRRPADRRSRIQRWNDTVAALADLQAEYVVWLEALPDNQQESATAEALQAIADLDLARFGEPPDPPPSGRSLGR